MDDLVLGRDDADYAVAPATAHHQEWRGPVVPPGHIVRTEYVSIHDVVCLTAASQLYPAEVERAYRRQLELGDEQAWPPPIGYWRAGGRFVLTDGRNRYVAALMLGFEYLLVASLVSPAAPPAIAASSVDAHPAPFRCGCGGWVVEVDGMWCCPIYLTPATSHHNGSPPADSSEAAS
jgi:hypothetical protein